MSTGQTIGRIANKEILACAPAATIVEAARLMAQSRCSSIVVVENGGPVGIWTERDALSIDFTDPEALSRPIAAVMSQPIKTIHDQTGIGDAGLRFQMEGVRHFVVVDDAGHPVGIVSQSDVILRHGVEHFLVLRPVRAAITKPMVSLTDSTSLAGAVARMRAARVDAALVVGEYGDAPGIITERDIVRVIAQGGALPPDISAIASRPLVSMREDDSLLAARNMLEERHIRHLAVTDDDGRVVGLLSFSDILAALQYEYVQRLDEALRERDEACEELEVLRGLIEGETWAGAVLRRERDEARSALEESEHAMHLRIRNGYDKTVADSWRAKVAEVEAEREALRAALRGLLLSRDASWTGGHDWAEAVGDAVRALGVEESK